MNLGALDKIMKQICNEVSGRQLAGYPHLQNARQVK